MANRYKKNLVISKYILNAGIPYNLDNLQEEWEESVLKAYLDNVFKYEIIQTVYPTVKKKIEDPNTSSKSNELLNFLKQKRQFIYDFLELDKTKFNFDFNPVEEKEIITEEIKRK